MIELPIVISDEALTDLSDIEIWYEKQKPFLGDEFLLKFSTDLLERICSNLKGFSKYSGNSNIREYIMKRFPFRIFYDSSTIPIKIIAVIHTTRLLKYIKRRLK